MQNEIHSTSFYSGGSNIANIGDSNIANIGEQNQVLKFETNTNFKSTTKSVDWYSRKIAEQKMSPLAEIESSIIKDALQAERDEKENKLLKVNRTFEEFLKDNERYPFKTLILGSGEKHANQPTEKPIIYTIDIDEKAKPDIVGSINDPSVMQQLPDESFDQVIWEYVPALVLLNKENFKQVHRVLKKDGIAALEIPITCARTLPILIQKTPFNNQIPVDYGRGIEFLEMEDSFHVNREGFKFVEDNKNRVTLKKVS